MAGSADSTKINMTWPLPRPAEGDQRQAQQHQQAGLGDPPRAVAQRDRRQQQRRRQAADLAHRVQHAQHRGTRAVLRQPPGDDRRPGPRAEIEGKDGQQHVTGKSRHVRARAVDVASASPTDAAIQPIAGDP